MPVDGQDLLIRTNREACDRFDRGIRIYHDELFDREWLLDSEERREYRVWLSLLGWRLHSRLGHAFGDEELSTQLDSSFESLVTAYANFTQLTETAIRQMCSRADGAPGEARNVQHLLDDAIRRQVNDAFTLLRSNVKLLYHHAVAHVRSLG
jgi:hypothetical protein